MKNWQLNVQQKEKLMAGTIILVGALVMFGQVIDSQLTAESDWVTTIKTYIDPVQYMVGMLCINLILVYVAIKKHEQIPNPLLNVLKWNFTLLFIDDFLILFMRVIQNNNLIALKSSLTLGMGKTYMMMATIRSLTDLTFTSAATLLLVYGLNRYSSVSEPPKGLPKLGRIMCWLVAVQWLVSIPISFSAFISSRLLFSFSLGLSQFSQIAVAAMMFWTVKENYQKYRTKFFRFLNQYYVITLAITGLVLTYSIGSFGVLQRFPAGESAVVGGFGSIVFYLSRLAYIVLNYLMFQAITNYREAGNSFDNHDVSAQTGEFIRG